jgi:hypothetical protein
MAKKHIPKVGLLYASEYKIGTKILWIWKIT